MDPTCHTLTPFLFLFIFSLPYLLLQPFTGEHSRAEGEHSRAEGELQASSSAASGLRRPRVRSGVICRPPWTPTLAPGEIRRRPHVRELELRRCRSPHRRETWETGEKNRSGAAPYGEFQRTERTRIWRIYSPGSRSTFAAPHLNSRGSGSAPLCSRRSPTKHIAT
jgi:hypothetical protein